ncbi:hypothetical protein CPB86DRAFT_781282 [Serendipita vermifera]|nr:hypothetical protein CPB86DRAFT_781282 [Serendipita vermifera]
MLFKKVIYALLASTAVMAQSGCVNQACIAANKQYQECLYSVANFKSCLCTKAFLTNYDRCLGGTVCAYDPTVTRQLCPAVYCPGKFDGGFDAKVFCGIAISTSKPPATRSTYTQIVTLPIETGPA